MRLICPNCGATYEVDAGLIPAGGRDVQCSNCGHGWFQAPDDAGDEADTVEAPEAAASPDGEAREADDASVEPVEVVEADEEPSHEAETATETETETVEAEEVPPRRRELEPGIADILRQEAEREAAARRAEQSSGLESQPDLGLDEVSAEEETRDQGAAARARMSRLRGMDEGEPERIERQQTRKEVLPDVDEINSTLRGQEERGETPRLSSPPEPRRRGGFRAGFLLVVLLCAILVAVYALAPRIAEMVPDATPALTAYVDWVNALRVQVDAAVQSGVDWVQGLIGE